MDSQYHTYLLLYCSFLYAFTSWIEYLLGTITLLSRTMMKKWVTGYSCRLSMASSCILCLHPSHCEQTIVKLNRFGRPHSMTPMAGLMQTNSQIAMVTASMSITLQS